ncbi:hypothetical protein [Runella sp.]|uniref:hypothetical protein n=1 Tax=Runella sp. TaxID=1960881 RepID=UPI003D0AC79F
MSEQTHILADSAEVEKETPAKKTDNSQRAKQVVAVAGGVAVGVGAIAVDAYAENEKSTADDIQTPENVATADSTAAATDSTAVATEVPTVAPTTETVADTTSANSQPTTEPIYSAPTTEVHADSTAVTMLPDNVAVVNAPDSMSFEEAFSAVRNEVGPGSLFEWHGNLYHTYHPDEFASLPQEMKDVYAALWLADQSQTDGIEVVPETEGNYVVYDINVGDAATAPTNDTQSHTEYATDTTTTADQEEYITQVDEPITEDEYDNDYDGSGDFMNPEDLA